MITTSAIRDAYSRIRPHTMLTPLIRSPYLSRRVGGDIYLKLESEQHTGSFKARGSLNKLIWLNEQEDDRVPVTASTGNHGLGFARALKLLNMEGIIYLPENASEAKVEAIREYGITLEFFGNDPYQTETHTRQLAEKKGWVYVSPYNDPEIISGQGTIGVELSDQLGRPDAVLATVGGGGLISGIGTWIKEKYRGTQLIGCQPEQSPEMSASVRAGKYVEMGSGPTLSDGSAGGFERDAITFDLCKRLVDDFTLVSEKEIEEGIRLMLQKHHKLIEGAAAVALAGLLKEAERYRNKTVVVIICGSNITYTTLQDILCSSV